MKYIYFQNVDSVEELKKQYKTLAFKYHPDREGGSVSAMQRINAEYDELLKAVRNVHKTADGKTYTKKEESRADVAVSVVFRVFPYTAGVEYDDIRLLLAFALRISARAQNARNLLRFVYVHLTAVRYNPILLFHSIFQKNLLSFIITFSRIFFKSFNFVASEIICANFQILLKGLET